MNTKLFSDHRLQHSDFVVNIQTFAEIKKKTSLFIMHTMENQLECLQQLPLQKNSVHRYQNNEKKHFLLRINSIMPVQNS